VTRRHPAAGVSIALRIGERAAMAAGAIAFAAILALPAGRAAAHPPSPHSSPHKSSNNNNSDDDNNGGSSASPSTPASVSGGGGNSGGANVGGGGGGNVGALGGAGGHGGGIALPGSHGPGEPRARLGLDFNNSSASVSASVPLGGHHPAEHRNDRITHPIFAIPFDHSSGGHSLSHALSYGATGAPSPFGGGSPALTNRLIHSVTSTYSDHFVRNLGHSLRMQEPGGMHQAATLPGGPGPGGGNDLASKLMQAKRSIATAAATPANASAVTRSLGARAPATIVSNRFAGISPNAFEARVFTVPAANETRFVPREIVVGVPAGLSTEEIAAIARRHDLAPVAGGTLTDSGLTLQRWRITDDRPMGEVIRSLEAENGLQSAQPDFRFKLAQAAGLTEQPADGFSVQYAPAKLHLAQAHRLTTGGGVIIAVIDTGIDRTHPELAGAILASFDAVGTKEPPDAHGTAIAGAIVSHSRLSGVAPGARLLAIRAFSTTGADAEATTMTVVRSIGWAVAHGARVINMSFAGAHDPLIARALADARRHGIVLVAAAGNAGPSSPPLYPAADANVIAVSATDVDDHLLDVANRGRQIALAAPGVDVLLPAPHARYQIATGTSFAAAHVAGIAALMLAKNSRLTPDDIRAELVATARDLGPKGRDDMFGAGLADAYKAVVAATRGTPQTVATK
jgi:subtilisin family serine protease